MDEGDDASPKRPEDDARTEDEKLDKLAGSIVPRDVYAKLAQSIVPPDLQAKLAASIVPPDLQAKLAASIVPPDLNFRLSTLARQLAEDLKYRPTANITRPVVDGLAESVEAVTHSRESAQLPERADEPVASDPNGFEIITHLVENLHDVIEGQRADIVEIRRQAHKSAKDGRRGLWIGGIGLLITIASLLFALAVA